MDEAATASPGEAGSGAGADYPLQAGPRSQAYAVAAQTDSNSNTLCSSTTDTICDRSSGAASVCLIRPTDIMNNPTGADQDIDAFRRRSWVSDALFTETQRVWSLLLRCRQCGIANASEWSMICLVLLKAVTRT